MGNARLKHIGAVMFWERPGRIEVVSCLCTIGTQSLGGDRYIHGIHGITVIGSAGQWGERRDV